MNTIVSGSAIASTARYPTSTVVDPDMPPRPDGLYGVSKVAGEALGRLYCDKFGLQIASVRIGSFEQSPRDERQLSTWPSPTDGLAAFLAAMTTPDLGYAAFYAVSRNTRRWWDLAHGEAIGCSPVDDAEHHAGHVPLGTARAEGPQGGPYALPGYTLDRQRRS